MTIIPVALFCVVSCGPKAPAPDVLILEGVHIVDVDSGMASEARCVLIESGTVTDIADSPRADWPPAIRPPVAGQYLTPALYDAHVHIFDARDLRMYALFGIQAVRNMDGWRWHLALRDQEIDGGRPRAMLYTAGSQLQAPGISDGDDALERVDSERQAGYDWVKLYDDLPRPALDALAERSEMRFTGHLPSRIPLPEVLESAVYDDIAHVEELQHALGDDYPEGEAGLDALADAMTASGAALTTTIVNNQMIAEQVADIEANLARQETAYAPPLLQAFWGSDFNPWRAAHDGGSAEGFARQVGSLKALAVGLHARGVQLLAGTDAPNPTTVPGVSMHQELALLVDAGLTAAEAIRSATTATADHLAPGTRGARAEVGAAAWFIVSRGNPLEDVTALRRFDGLVIEGEWWPREAVEAVRQSMIVEYARDYEILRHLEPGSPDAIFAAIDKSDHAVPISAEGLTSLVWFYEKVGNTHAAQAVAEKMEALGHTP